MKHEFLPNLSLFYLSLIASSYPSLSFRFEILANLKLTEEGTSKAWAQATPGLSANRTQRLGYLVAIPAKNLSSSLNGVYFLPEEAKQPSSIPGQSFFSHAQETAAGWAHTCVNVTSSFSSALEQCM